jgi:long-subunit acyl-CoA synthetase (AMP-forming)
MNADEPPPECWYNGGGAAAAGPDCLFPAESFYASKLNDSVKLRTSERDLKKFPLISIYTMFKRTVELNPNHAALCFKSNATDSDYVTIKYSDYWKICHKVAKSFLKVISCARVSCHTQHLNSSLISLYNYIQLGLNPSECVSILGSNSPHWFMSLLGVIFAGYDAILDDIIWIFILYVT